jgi:hypothetical protein
VASVIALVACVATSPVVAQTADDEAKNNTLTIYLWGSSISGDLSFRDAEVPFDISLEQILDNLEMTAMVAYKRDIGDWSVLLDVIYLNMGATKNGTVTLPTERAATLELDVRADLKVKAWVGGLYGGYTFARSGPANHQFIAGVRYLSLDGDVSIDSTGPRGEPLDGRTFMTSGDLFDGVIGFQGVFDLGGRWQLPYHVDIGTGDSRITYQGVAGVGYTFGWGELSLGYRYLYYDQGNDGTIHELTMDGPMMSVGFRF